MTALVAGCSGGGGGEDGPPVAPVTGRISRKGAPLAGASVTFRPATPAKEGETSSPSMGYTDADGNYELVFTADVKGAIIGPHKVTIFKDSALDEDGVAIPNPVIIPPQYNAKSTLEVTVPPEGLEGGAANFDLDF